MVRGSRFLERAGRRLAYLSFDPGELANLQVAEWEAFGAGGPFVDHQLFAWELDLFANHVRANDRILVVGAGTGRDVFPFLEKGHDVTALDIAPRALVTLKERARALGFEVTVVEGSVAEAVLPAASFDAIVFSWFCFSYLRGASARRAALDRCRAALRPGGRILISFPSRHPPKDLPAGPSPLERRIARFLGSAPPEAGDQFNLGGTAGKPSAFFVHAFAPGEIEEAAREAALDVAERGEPASGVGVLVLTPRPQGAAW